MRGFVQCAAGSPTSKCRCASAPPRQRRHSSGAPGSCVVARPLVRAESASRVPRTSHTSATKEGLAATRRRPAQPKQRSRRDTPPRHVGQDVDAVVGRDGRVPRRLLLLQLQRNRRLVLASGASHLCLGPHFRCRQRCRVPLRLLCGGAGTRLQGGLHDAPKACRCRGLERRTAGVCAHACPRAAGVEFFPVHAVLPPLPHLAPDGAGHAAGCFHRAAPGAHVPGALRPRAAAPGVSVGACVC